MSNWPRATKDNPCPVCGHTRRCHVRSDNKAGRCYWPAEGNPPHPQEGQDDNGEYVLWYTDPPANPGTSAPTERPKRKETPKAKPEDCAPVYSRLLELCPVNAAHAHHLEKTRGLNQAAIKRLRFGSLPGREMLGDVVDTLRREFGQEHLLRVPGFIRGKKGDVYLSSAGTGILIPYVVSGKVVAIELRLDDPGDGARYRWISSGTKGVSVETVGYLAGENLSSDTVVITEGAFKALAASKMFNLPAIGMPGIGNIHKGLAALREIGATKVLFAPDADHAGMPEEGKSNQVFRSALRGIRRLWDEGYEVTLLRWVRGLYTDGQPKGIDDAIAAGAKIDHLNADEICFHFSQMAEQFGVNETIVAPEPDRKKKPVIVVNGRDPEYIDTELLSHLADDGRFYARGDKVACLAKGPDGLRIDIQTHEKMAFRIPKVVKLVNRKERDGKDTVDTIVRPNKHLTGAALVGGAEVFPPLYKVVNIPFFASDGRLVQTRGYDEKSCIYYEPSMRIRVPESPTREEVMSRLDFLRREFFREFAFAGEADRCHSLCALLQPFAVELINARSPAYLFRANQSDSGKTFLAQCIGVIAFGGVPEVSEEEASTRAKGTEIRKQLDTHLIDGAQGILIDNIESDLNYPWLFQYLTSQWLEPRILGKSEKAKIPNRILWMITANTPNLKADAVRRLVPIKFDLGDLEGGHQRTFERANLGEWIIEHRTELIEACLTIIAGWVAAGAPRSKTATLNSYSEWAATMGGLMEYLEVPGFLANAKSHRAELDEAANLRREIIGEIVSRHGLVRNADTRLLLAAVEAAELVPPQVDLNGSDKRQIQQFARYLKRIADTTPRVGPYRLLRTRNSVENKTGWTIEKIEQPSLNDPEVRHEPPEVHAARVIRNGAVNNTMGAKSPEVTPPNGHFRGTSGEPPEPPDRINTRFPEVPEVHAIKSVDQNENEKIGFKKEKHTCSVRHTNNLRTSGTSGTSGIENRTLGSGSREQKRLAQLEGLSRVRGGLSGKLKAELDALRAKVNSTEPPSLALDPAGAPPRVATLVHPPAASPGPPLAAAGPPPPRRSRLDDDDDLYTALDGIL